MVRKAKGEAAAGDAVEAGGEQIGRRSSRLRLRAAWMYYVEEMTQNAIAEALGIGRVTVVRLLADARALHEVKIALRRDVAELPRLETELERTFGLTQAIVAPLSGEDADPTAAIGAATGQFLSDAIKPDMRVGVGWGRTLLGTLNFIDETQVSGVAVVSLLGGISAVRQFNPAEFAWKFSRLFHADCYLIAAPALVDSPATKQTLIERCGIGPVFEIADKLDAVLLSVGGMSADSTSQLFDFYTEADRRELIRIGAVGDVLYNFYDREGRIVDHPLNERVMSISVEQMCRTPQRILTSGGRDKTDALLGAIRLLKPTVFITDEISARRLLDTAG